MNAPYSVRMRAAKLILASSILLMLPTSLLAEAEKPSRYFAAADLFSLQSASDPQISPDAKIIAYVRESADIETDRVRPSIWLIDVASGKQTPLAPLVGDSSNPVWSPDGKKLAYLFAAPGEKRQLYARTLSSGATVKLTDQPDPPFKASWSPDGTKLAYVRLVPGAGPKRYGSTPSKPEGAKWAPPLQFIERMPWQTEGGDIKPGFDQIFVVSAEGGESRQLTSDSFNNDGPGQLTWFPDGRSIVFSAKRKPGWEASVDDYDIYALDVASQSITPITTRVGPDESPAISPDGKLIAYLGHDDKTSYENTVLYLMKRDGSSVQALTANFDVSIEKPIWAKDGKSIFMMYTEQGVARVGRITLDGRRTELARNLVGSYTISPFLPGVSYSVAANGTIALLTGSALRPSNIAVVEKGRLRKLTSLSEELLGAKTLGAVRELNVRAPDGLPVPAWLVLPADYQPGKRYPTVLQIHGGPHGAFAATFSSELQLFAAAGYATVYTNPRGSQGYGAKWAQAIEYDFPGPEVGDLMAAVDAAIAEGVADPDNLFITGFSGGGVLTAWIIGKTNRFKAAVAQQGLYDWIGFGLSSDLWNYTSNYFFNHVKPWEAHEEYWRRSPLSLMASVTTPTMVLVGGEDRRVTVNQSQQYYQALHLQGVPTVLVKVPGVAHSALTSSTPPSQTAGRVSAVIAWFDQYQVKK